MFDFLSTSFLGESVSKFLGETGFANLFAQEGGYKYLIMIAVGCFFLYLAIKHKFEPMLLVPIGFGIIIGNIPMVDGHAIGIYEEGSVLNYLYFGVRYGVYPPLIFLGVGAMTDFSSLISNPKLMLIGAAARSASSPPTWAPSRWDSRPTRPVRSPLSAVRTVRRPSSSRAVWRRSIWVRSPFAPTPTWHWCR